MLEISVLFFVAVPFPAPVLSAPVDILHSDVLLGFFYDPTPANTPSLFVLYEVVDVPTPPDIQPQWSLDDLLTSHAI